MPQCIPTQHNNKGKKIKEGGMLPGREMEEKANAACRRCIDR
jgi:hypothetical protein